MLVVIVNVLCFGVDPMGPFVSSLVLIVSHVLTILLIRYIFRAFYNIMIKRQFYKMLVCIFKDFVAFFFDRDFDDDDNDLHGGAKEKHSFNYPKFNNKITQSVSKLNNY